MAVLRTIVFGLVLAWALCALAPERTSRGASHTNPLLAPFLVKIVKMWRKLGAWLWSATQNMEDYPDAAKKMLNMVEWWLCLVMPKEEVEQIARFKDLTDVQRSLLLSARKEPGKYVEGVVLDVNREYQQVLIDHKEIEGFMPAMTMITVWPNHIHHCMKTTRPLVMVESCKKCIASSKNPELTIN